MKVESISPLILNVGTREVSEIHIAITLAAGKDPYSERTGDCFVVRAGLGGAVLENRKLLAHAEIRNPDRPARSKSLY